MRTLVDISNTKEANNCSKFKGYFKKKCWTMNTDQ